eukprot:CAMPEP_0177723870 /NCGR_PEP_ID=MMETSP0484_2-20121128/18432_1 /TAXON_ID=354590 /ORGANISM="Rhodomonas lens, Strain RHODO" /LENGTH=90 /DNA_ID=CAMNT_0019236313 /DNA_START=196 /DNA_END=469 /DNA_ORIENTATION=-
MAHDTNSDDPSTSPTAIWEPWLEATVAAMTLATSPAPLVAYASSVTPATSSPILVRSAMMSSAGQRTEAAACAIQMKRNATHASRITTAK